MAENTTNTTIDINLVYDKLNKSIERYFSLFRYLLDFTTSHDDTASKITNLNNEFPELAKEFEVIRDGLRQHYAKSYSVSLGITKLTQEILRIDGEISADYNILVKEIHTMRLGNKLNADILTMNTNNLMDKTILGKIQQDKLILDYVNTKLKNTSAELSMFLKDSTNPEKSYYNLPVAIQNAITDVLGDLELLSTYYGNNVSNLLALTNLESNKDYKDYTLGSLPDEIKDKLVTKCLLVNDNLNKNDVFKYVHGLLDQLVNNDKAEHTMVEGLNSNINLCNELKNRLTEVSNKLPEYKFKDILDNVLKGLEADVLNKYTTQEITKEEYIERTEYYITILKYLMGFIKGHYLISKNTSKVIDALIDYVVDNYMSIAKSFNGAED